MTKTVRNVLFIAGGVGLVLLLKGSRSWKEIVEEFLPNWEGFSSKPYWDVSRWSWGYGTRVPGSVDNKNINPGGTITREKAMREMMWYLESDYTYLDRIITRKLKPQQWAALLTFSYNLGNDDADNLAANINSGNDLALEVQWKKYIYVSGEISQYQIKRRAAEWDLFSS